MHLIRPLLPLAGLLVLGTLTLACGPAASPAAQPTPAGGPFAVVRATSEAAYQSGLAHIERGEFLQACVDLDTAKINDPDNRPEVQQALDQALARCLTPVAEPTSTQPRTIVVATIAAAAIAQPTPATINQRTPPTATQLTPAAVDQPALASGSQPTQPVAPSRPENTAQALAATPPAQAPAATPPAQAPAATPPAQALVAWTDPQGRFSLSAPLGWTSAAQPQSLFGSGAVEFRDPSGHAEVDVAVDAAARAVSPELYAASMELAMQQQVPGYAAEQMLPGSAAGTASVRRVFTFTQRDAAGQNHQARGFQVTLVKGSTPYIISGSAPASDFQQYRPMFDQMVDSFRFS